MKKLVVMILVMSSASLSLAAEPGRVANMGYEAAKVARILLDRQLNRCVDELQREDVAITDVTAQSVAAGVTRYEVRGVMLEGGDIAKGRINLSIEETVRSGGYGPAPMTYYTCTVSKTSLR